MLGTREMASPLFIKQLASEKEDELKALREQHTQVLEEVVAGQSVW